MGIKILFLQNTNINNECKGAIPVLKCFAGLGPKLPKLNDKFLSTCGNLGKLIKMKGNTKCDCSNKMRPK